MKIQKQKNILFLILLISSLSKAQEIKLPINVRDRKSLAELHLSEIGEFGLLRKERSNIPAHFHTGIDILRPGINYENNPIFPITEGIVISKRDDGPYAQIIIEHHQNGTTFWSLYEHIAGITVTIHDEVNASSPIARFMNRNELNTYGWQFDHFHLEILKIAPKRLQPSPTNPTRFFNSFTLVCFTRDDLEKYFYTPIPFFERMLLH